LKLEAILENQKLEKWIMELPQSLQQPIILAS